MQARSILVVAALLAGVAGVALFVVQTGPMRADRPAHSSVRGRFQPVLPAPSGAPLGRDQPAGIGSVNDLRPWVVAHQ